MNKGHVTVKIETFNEDGTRSNIECFSLSQESFLFNRTEYELNMQQCYTRTAKEILTPTPKTPMA